MPGLVQGGKDFLAAHDIHIDTDNQIKDGGHEAKERDRLVKEEWAHLKKIGYEVAIIVNCLPWAIDAWIGTRHVTVKAAMPDKGELFTYYVCRQPYIDMRDRGDAKFDPKAIMPVEIAMEFERKYVEEGGVFMIRGAELPENILALVEEAQLRMYRWFEQQYQVACDVWQNTRNIRRISDPMRHAAKYLQRRGAIQNLPEWVSLTRDVDTTLNCDNCQTVIAAKAKTCHKCGFIIDMEWYRLNAHRLPGGSVIVAEETATVPWPPQAKSKEDGEGSAEPDKDDLATLESDKTEAPPKEPMSKPKKEKKDKE